MRKQKSAKRAPSQSAWQPRSQGPFFLPRESTLVAAGQASTRFLQIPEM